MAVRKFKPTTPGQRHKIIGTFEEITARVPEKSLVFGKKSSGGRNNTGKMTMRYIGGGHKRMYRIIDFRRDKDNCPATVKTIEYDPNRSARIALLHYTDGEKRYILAPVGLKQGDVVMSGVNERNGVVADIIPGNALPMQRIPCDMVIVAIGQGIEIADDKGETKLVDKDVALKGVSTLTVGDLPMPLAKIETKDLKAQFGGLPYEWESLKLNFKSTEKVFKP